MSCCDGYTNPNPEVDECPGCGGPVDKDGDTTEHCCNWSPVVCDVCGWTPCDLSC